jgi:hypothetical protein
MQAGWLPTPTGSGVQGLVIVSSPSSSSMSIPPPYSCPPPLHRPLHQSSPSQAHQALYKREETVANWAKLGERAGENPVVQGCFWAPTPE